MHFANSLGARELQRRVARHGAEVRIGAEQLTNANDVVSQTTRYGAAWQNVTGVLPPRMVKLGVQIDF